ncbi:MAG: hypothetical protein U1A77_25765 [Pirellulales bacterium]
MNRDQPDSEHNQLDRRTSDHSDERPPSGSGTGAMGRKWTTRVVILLFVLLVCGPLLFSQFPTEVARWHQAAAVEAFLDGNLDQARQSLAQALEWAPGDVWLLVQRASWERELGNYEQALATCEEALERGDVPLRVYWERSQIYQHMGRWQDAVEDWRKIESIVQQGGVAMSEATVLNGLAYARALANIELDEALRDVNRSLELTGKQAALLDTRGYIHFRRGAFESARADLNEAISLLEAEQRSGGSQDKTKGRETTHEDPREERRLKKERDHTLAVLLYHRLLILEELEAEVEADMDRKRIVELGFEPSEKLF